MNNENLRPQNLRTKEEQREIARKGGIASGESRRRSRSMKTILKQMARMDVINEDLKAILESMGVDPTQDVAMAFSIVNEAIRGNVRAFDAYMKYFKPFYYSFYPKDGYIRTEWKPRRIYVSSRYTWETSRRRP